MRGVSPVGDKDQYFLQWEGRQACFRRRGPTFYLLWSLLVASKRGPLLEDIVMVLSTMNSLVPVFEMFLRYIQTIYIKNKYVTSLLLMDPEIASSSLLLKKKKNRLHHSLFKTITHYIYNKIQTLLMLTRPYVILPLPYFPTSSCAILPLGSSATLVFFLFLDHSKYVLFFLNFLDFFY